MRKQERQRAARAAPPATQADSTGKGVVVFDVETTQLIGETDTIEDLEVSVATALWVGDGDKPEDGTWMTAWHDTVRTAPGGGDTKTVADMLAWMDGARIIVAYNGANFDMRVLRKYYGSDSARWYAHLQKLHDPAQQVRRTAGRNVKLDRLLQLNGIPGKAGSGADAPRWWTEGEWQKLAMYCERDTGALAELVYRARITVPGGTTHEASIHSALDGQRTTRRPRGEDEEERVRRARRPRHSGTAAAASNTPTTAVAAPEATNEAGGDDAQRTLGKRKARPHEEREERRRNSRTHHEDNTPHAHNEAVGTSGARHEPCKVLFGSPVVSGRAIYTESSICK